MTPNERLGLWMILLSNLLYQAANKTTSKFEVILVIIFIAGSFFLLNEKEKKRK